MFLIILGASALASLICLGITGRFAFKRCRRRWALRKARAQESQAQDGKEKEDAEDTGFGFGIAIPGIAAGGGRNKRASTGAEGYRRQTLHARCTQHEINASMMLGGHGPKEEKKEDLSAQVDTDDAGGQGGGGGRMGEMFGKGKKDKNAAKAAARKVELSEDKLRDQKKLLKKLGDLSGLKSLSTDAREALQSEYNRKWGGGPKKSEAFGARSSMNAADKGKKDGGASPRPGGSPVASPGGSPAASPRDAFAGGEGEGEKASDEHKPEKHTGTDAQRILEEQRKQDALAKKESRDDAKTKRPLQLASICSTDTCSRRGRDSGSCAGTTTSSTRTSTPNLRVTKNATQALAHSAGRCTGNTTFSTRTSIANFRVTKNATQAPTYFQICFFRSSKRRHRPQKSSTLFEELSLPTQSC